MGNKNTNLPKAKVNTGITEYLSIESVKKQINQAVGKNSMRFVSSVVSAVTNNPALQECSNKSILSAALFGESLNLSPSPQLGQYYMVPYNNKKERTMEAQFQMGYKGYIQLAIRSGQYKKLNVLAIKEGELVKYDPLLEEIEVRLIEDEEEREKAKTIGYYAMFEYVNGFRKSLYWSKKKMLEHADKYSQAFSKDARKKKITNKDGKEEWVQIVSFEDFEAGDYNKNYEWLYSSFWYKDFDGMAYKTMLRQLISKWGIMSIDMVSAMDADMAVIHEDGTKEYIDNGSEVNVIDAEAEELKNPFEGKKDARSEEIGGQQEINLEGGADEADGK